MKGLPSLLILKWGTVDTEPLSCILLEMTHLAMCNSKHWV